MTWVVTGGAGYIGSHVVRAFLPEVFVQHGETLEAAFAREVWEETGRRVSRVRYLLSQPWPLSGALMLGMAARTADVDAQAPTDGELTRTVWASRDEQMVDLNIPCLGEQRTDWQYPFRGFADSATHLAMGSDWPVSTPNPWDAIHVAVNRSIPPGEVEPGAIVGGIPARVIGRR